MDLEFFNELMGRYGPWAIFFLAMIEGDITLLLAGVLAHGQAFGDYSFAQVLAVGTLGGVASDNAAYLLGRGARSGVKKWRFYCVARPRIERLEESAARELPKLARAAECEGLDVEELIVHGEPAAEIVRVARERGADLIVISSHGRTGLGRILFGSTAESVVRYAPCPVLVVKPSQGDK